jgi:hypothetical protein
MTNTEFERFKDDLESRLQEYIRHHTRFKFVEDIRRKFNLKYPDPEDQPGHEHPMDAVGIVLLSSAILGTANVEKLVKFTGYSSTFISAIAFNMENNKLWVDGEYREEQYWRWFSPDGSVEDQEFWENIGIACGEVWVPEAHSEDSMDTCKIYWGELPPQGLLARAE